MLSLVIVCIFFFFFFFSSRRRHTRLVSDWSSDVCSSDLMETPASRLARTRGSPCDPRSRGMRRCATPCWGVPACPPPPAQVGVVPIADPRRLQRGGERVLGEVRVPARGRIAAHVHDEPQPIRRQPRHEGLEAPRRVADGVDHPSKIPGSYPPTGEQHAGPLDRRRRADVSLAACAAYLARRKP